VSADISGTAEYVCIAAAQSKAEITAYHEISVPFAMENPITAGDIYINEEKIISRGGCAFARIGVAEYWRDTIRNMLLKRST